jgi:hypothetical protein
VHSLPHGIGQQISGCAFTIGCEIDRSRGRPDDMCDQLSHVGLLSFKCTLRRGIDRMVLLDRDELAVVPDDLPALRIDVELEAPRKRP